jgi:hypothetical protein
MSSRPQPTDLTAAEALAAVAVGIAILVCLLFVAGAFG